MHHMVDLTGKNFGRLTAIRILPKQTNNSLKVRRGMRWHCSCECGGSKDVFSADLQSGYVKSCGCLLTGSSSTAATKKHPESVPGLVSSRRLYQCQIYGAKKRGIEFNLTLDEFRTITSKNCFYCGVKPKQEHLVVRKNYRAPYISNGIDRVDSSKGYILENVVPCCTFCNTIKSKLSQEQFAALVVKIHNHWSGNHQFSQPTNTSIKNQIPCIMNKQGEKLCS
jgi:hypothetical protein